MQVARQTDFNNPNTKEYEAEPNSILEGIIVSGQKEGTVVDGSPYMLSGFYWSMVHAMAIKKVFYNQHEIFKAAMLSRLLLKDKSMEGEN